MDNKDKRTEGPDPGDRYVGKTNVADYGVPAGVQLTENMIEEIAEAALYETPEKPPEEQPAGQPAPQPEKSPEE